MTDEIKNEAGLENDSGPAQPKDQALKRPRKTKRERSEGAPGLGGRGGDERDGARGGQR